MRRLFLGLVLALLPTVALAEPKPGWIADPRTGCKVWNPHPQPNETILWSGLCGNGIANGRGVLQRFQDSKLVQLAEGNYRDGRLHGRGVYIWANDDRYEGDYDDGKQQGRGVYTWENGNRYEGDYVDDKPHGQGVYTLTDGNLIRDNGPTAASSRETARLGSPRPRKNAGSPIRRGTPRCAQKAAAKKIDFRGEPAPTSRMPELIQGTAHDDLNRAIEA